MSIQITGIVTVKETGGAVHHINADEFMIDEHQDNDATAFIYDADDWRISILAEEKNGVISTDEWETLDCLIIENTITFSIGEDK